MTAPMLGWSHHGPPSLSALARYPVALPLAAIAAGAVGPLIADVAHATLPLIAPVVVGLAVLATEMAPPSWREMRTALLIVAATAVPGVLVVLAIAWAVNLPHDLALAAALVAASPVAVICGIMSQSFGLPARPAIWAALLSILAAPAVLPMAAAICGTAGLLDPDHLARSAALRGALPALIALAVRRAAPRVVVAWLPVCRGLTVLALLPLGLAAGGSLGAAVARPTEDGLKAAVLSIATLTGCSAVAALIGRLLIGGQGAVALAVAGATRNASFVWAAAAGALTARSEVVFAVAVAAAFALPGALRLLMAASRHVSRPTATLASAGRRATMADPAVIAGPIPNAASAMRESSRYPSPKGAVSWTD